MRDLGYQFEITATFELLGGRKRKLRGWQVHYASGKAISRDTTTEREG